MCALDMLFGNLRILSIPSRIMSSDDAPDCHSNQRKSPHLLERYNLKNKDTSTPKQCRSLANEIMSIWVHNSSQRILSDPELSVLKKGLNFAVTPKRLPVEELVTVTESACRSQPSEDVS